MSSSRTGPPAHDISSTKSLVQLLLQLAWPCNGFTLALTRVLGVQAHSSWFQQRWTCARALVAAQ